MHKRLQTKLPELLANKYWSVVLLLAKQVSYAPFLLSDAQLLTVRNRIMNLAVEEYITLIFMLLRVRTESCYPPLEQLVALYVWFQGHICYKGTPRVDKCSYKAVHSESTSAKREYLNPHLSHQLHDDGGGMYSEACQSLLIETLNSMPFFWHGTNYWFNNNLKNIVRKYFRAYKILYFRDLTLV